MKHFNEYVLEKRIEKRLSLREFCKQTALDPSNWSKVERGITKQVHSKSVLESISTALNLSSHERNTLMDLALIDTFPIHLTPSENIVEKLPLIFKTLRGEKCTKEELEFLFKLIRDDS